MNLDQIIKALELKVLTNPQDFTQIVPSGGYTSDLLSCVMAGAKNHNIWVTLQAHSNVIAVAALLDLSAIIITEAAMPDSTTLEKANQEGIALLSTSQPSFYVVGKLWELGLRAE
jgi:hypothetical protein